MKNKKVKKNERITAAEKELRVFQVYHMVLNGYPRYKIILFGRDTWNACDRTIDGYISDVNQMMNDINIKNHQHNLSLMNARIEDLINKCYTENDKKTIVNLLKLQSEILGIKAADKVDITSGGNAITEIKLIQVNKKDEDV